MMKKQRAFKLTEKIASGKEVVFVAVLTFIRDIEGRASMVIVAASTGQFSYSEAMNSGYIEERNDHLERLHPEEEESVQKQMIDQVCWDIQQFEDEDLINPEKRKIGYRYPLPN